mmetsp:Transcript_53643/g.122796  ORF Transcript_53643/g.122796 Transcript_53643/m.122796 type:complete len:504 (-) Transcript_53643:273-1784(-)
MESLGSMIKCAPDSAAQVACHRSGHHRLAPLLLCLHYGRHPLGQLLDFVCDLTTRHLKRHLHSPQVLVHLRNTCDELVHLMHGQFLPLLILVGVFSQGDVAEKVLQELLLSLSVSSRAQVVLLHHSHNLLGSHFQPTNHDQFDSKFPHHRLLLWKIVQHPVQVRSANPHSLHKRHSKPREPFTQAVGIENHVLTPTVSFSNQFASMHCDSSYDKAHHPHVWDVLPGDVQKISHLQDHLDQARVGHGLEPVHILEPVGVDFLHHPGLQVRGHLAHQLPGTLGSLQLVPFLEVLFHTQRQQGVDTLKSDDPMDVIHALSEGTVLGDDFLRHRDSRSHHHRPDDPAQHHEPGGSRDLHLVPVVWGHITIPDARNGEHGEVHGHQVHLGRPDIACPGAVAEIIYKPGSTVPLGGHRHEAEEGPVAGKDVARHDHQHGGAQGGARDVGHVEARACQAQHGLQSHQAQNAGKSNHTKDGQRDVGPLPEPEQNSLLKRILERKNTQDIDH